MGIENGFRLNEFTQFFLCIRSKRMDGEKPSKIKTIKLVAQSNTTANNSVENKKLKSLASQVENILLKSLNLTAQTANSILVVLDSNEYKKLRSSASVVFSKRVLIPTSSS